MSNVVTKCWITWSCTQTTSHWKLRNQGLQTPYYNVAGWASYTISDYVLSWHVSSVMPFWKKKCSNTLRMNNDLAQLQIPWVTCGERKTFSRRIQKHKNWRLYTRLNNVHNQNEAHWMSPRFLKKNMFLCTHCSHIIYLSHVLTEGNVLRKTSCFCRAIVNGAQMLSVFQLNMQHLRNRNAKTSFCSNVLDLKDAGLRYCLRSPTIETSCVSRVWCVNAWEIPECQHKANWHSSRFQRRGRRCIVFC